MNYIGSKLSLLDFLDESIHKIAGNKNQVFCDLFSGTGIVGAHFKQKGYQIIANDIQYYSYVLTRHYVGNSKDLPFVRLAKKLPVLKKIKVENRKDWVIERLNELEGVRGFVYNNFCPGGTRNKKYQRQYFLDENGMKCDAIRQKIEEWNNSNLLNEGEYFFLLTSLLESIDKYANTSSVYGAFLKQIKSSAQKPFVLSAAKLYKNGSNHKIYNKDINTLIRKLKGDILYLDPPYNRRQYATNYHVLETIAKYDNPRLHGKTGLRDYQKEKSLYCLTQEVKSAFEDLIMNTRMKYIFLSYNNEGLMSEKQVKDIMSKKGKYGVFRKKYKRYKADNGREYSADNTEELLHYVICK